MNTRILSVLLLFLFHNAIADVSLPNIFGDHMVLQRNKPISFWGWAAPKEKVTIAFIGKKKSVVAGSDGQWKITFDPQTAGGPYDVTIAGKNTIKLKDILIGDVWVCSGQSNMEWPLHSTDHAEIEIASANFTTIRHIKIPNTIASEPQSDFPDAQWEICNSSTAANFTAVGYYFAKELTRNLGIPIGLINSTWGGTHVETWTSRKAFEESEHFNDMISSMPKISLDSLAAINNKQVASRLAKLQPTFPANRMEAEAWAQSDFDDSQWRTLNIPQFWESQELGEFDGVVWIRYKFNLEQEPHEKVTLSLGIIDDSDETWVNGNKVGSTLNDWITQRVYSIPAGTLKAGTNVIAIRIEDTGGAGGVYGEAKSMYVQMSDKTIPLSGIWKYRIESARIEKSIGANDYPTLLFNAMINPLLPMPVKGVIWYQGEANAARAFEYRKTFPLMINDWRNHWKQNDLPFYFVQLSSFNANYGTSRNGSEWAELREAQGLTLALQNTGMAVTVDIGNPSDIHPRNKQDVGKRLAAIALHKSYGKQNPYEGPVHQNVIINGNKVIITFKTNGGPLMAKDKYGYVKGFEVAGSDNKFFYAQAFIEENNVIVSSDSVSSPVSVRYGWADDASDCNLFNEEGFPASPFRTDSLRPVTETKRFMIH